MKLLFILLLSMSTLSATMYYSKVEPYDTKKISSNVMGEVIFVDENRLGKRLTKAPYIKIDSELDRDELKITNDKIEYLRETVSVNEKILQNLKESLAKKEKNYEQVKNLKIKSTVEKDREFYDLVASQNSVLATQKEINNLKVQISDLKLRKAQLVKSIEDKSLSADGFTLYSIDVKTGQVVNKGTPLATLVDTTKAILTLYLSEEDLLRVDKSVIYIDGVKTSYKVDRVLKIADTQNISKYKAQIIVKAPKVFSKLVKVELRDE